MATATQELTKEIRQTADAAVTNAKKTAESVRTGLTDAAGNVKDAAQNVFLAGLGALVSVKETGAETFESLVKKGETVDLGGLGTERVQEIRKQIDTASDRAEEAVKGRVSDVKYVAGETAQGLEEKIQDAVAVVMKRIGVPTRAEIAELTASVERLTARVEEAKQERTLLAEAPIGALTVNATGGGWYEIKTGDEVADKVKGRKAVVARLTALQETAEITTEAVGGGWYEVRVGTVVLEKVQGEEEAEALVAKLA
ncbi:MAG: phasin family protein [Bacteroidota bacterium]